MNESDALPPVDVYVVSDSSGETAERVVQAAAIQYGSRFSITCFPEVTGEEEIKTILRQARENRAVVVYTLVHKDLALLLELEASRGEVVALDLIGPLMKLLSAYAGEEPKEPPELLPTIDEAYFKRIDAVEFAVRYDDGKDVRGIRLADIVLIGVSRASKTPLSMYLAHKSIKVANVPLVPEAGLSEELFKVDPRRVIGLVIDPDKLSRIRQERLNSMGIEGQSSYTDPERISRELEFAQGIMQKIGCPVIDITNKAVEETAAKIIEIYNRRFHDEQ